MTTQPAGEQHTGTLNLTGDGNAPASPISDDAVGAFSEAYLLEILSRVSTASLPSNSAVRAGLLATYPAIRQQVAEEIAPVLAEFLGKPAGDMAAEITRRLGRGESL